jgi:hypothetical protein
MTVAVSIGRMGTRVRHAGRRGATAEDIQFMMGEAREEYPDTFTWLDSFCAGQYRIDLKPVFSTVGSALEIIIAFDDPQFATLAKMKACEDQNKFTAPFARLK